MTILKLNGSEHQRARFFFMAIAFLAGCGAALADSKVYFSDTFSSSVSDYYWSKSCSNRGHARGRKYPSLGQASRAGSCTIDGGHVRFVTMPFDVRLPMGADFFKGSGGAEIGPAEGRAVYPDDLLERGWDLTGQTYQRPDMDVGYQWDFRIVSLSLVEAGLVRHAAIGQFHSQNDPGGPCGPSPVNSSPSPGFDVALPDADHVKLTVYIKPVYKLIPQNLLRWVDRSCAADPDQPCQMVLWRGVYPRADILGQWMRLTYVIRFAPDATGSIAFSFGRKTATAAEERYQPRTFVNGSQKINVPMAANKCPQRIVLGIYAQGYSDADYGTDGERVRNGPSWVSPHFSEVYGKFIEGTQAPTERPPSIVVDYDNFRVFEP